MNTDNAPGTNLTESLLNFAWLMTAAAAMLGVLPSRCDGRAAATLLCGLALLFPIISASDDLSADATLAVLSVVVAAVVLTALFRLASEKMVVEPLHRTVPSDPRSPPRG
jgi:hypothetical protein